MSISPELPDLSPAAAMAEVVVALRELAETLWSARTDDELVEVVEQVQQASAVLAAVEAGALAETDARGVAKQSLHFGSTGDWLTHVGGLHRGEGRRRVVRAKALTGPLVRTRQGLVDGVVSPEQADVIVRSIEDLPSAELLRRRGERFLVRRAAQLNAGDLARAGRHLAEVVDPDAVERKLEAQLEREERAAHDHRFLSITSDRAGGVRIKGRGSAEDGALLTAALLPLTCPTPADPAVGEEQHDPRDHGARLWDALVLTARHSLDTTLPPDSHATPARLLVTLDHHTLGEGLAARGVATTADGTELPPGVVRRLACDAEVVPVVYGTGSEVLDVGRLRRLVTPAIWIALVVRDQHCTFPACH